MSNMSYCRFQNTVGDLEDCAEHLHDAFGTHENDRAEQRARARLVELCQAIIEECENVDDPDDLGTEDDDCAEVECEACENKIKLATAKGRLCDDCAEEDEPEPARAGPRVETVRIVCANSIGMVFEAPRLLEDWRCPSCGATGEGAIVTASGAVQCRLGHESR